MKQPLLKSGANQLFRPQCGITGALGVCLALVGIPLPGDLTLTEQFSQPMTSNPCFCLSFLSMEMALCLVLCGLGTERTVGPGLPAELCSQPKIPTRFSGEESQTTQLSITSVCDGDTDLLCARPQGGWMAVPISWIPELCSFSDFHLPLGATVIFSYPLPVGGSGEGPESASWGFLFVWFCF